MKKSLIIIPFVFLFFFTTEHSNAQGWIGQNLKFTITLQSGREIGPASFFTFQYTEKGSSGIPKKLLTVEVYYYVEENNAEIQRNINLHNVESIEFITNKEQKKLIEQINIDLWDGSKVIYKKVNGADDLIEEISKDGKKKTFKSGGFLCFKNSKEGNTRYLTHISASKGGKIFRNYYYIIKKINFQKTTKT